MKQLSWKRLLIWCGLIFWCGWIVTDGAALLAKTNWPGTGQDPSPNVWVDKIKVPAPASSPKKQRTRIRHQPRTKPIVAPLLTLQYQMKLRKEGSKLWTDINPRTTFYDGDILYFELTVNQNGYCYIFNWTEDQAGKVLTKPMLIFPDWQANNGECRLEKNQKIKVPSDENDPSFGLELTPPAGIEKLLIIFSREPINGIPNRLRKPHKTNHSGGKNQDESDLLYSWDDILTLRQLNPAQNMKRKTWLDLNPQERKISTEFAVWVINTNLQNNDEIIEEIELTHR